MSVHGAERRLVCTNLGRNCSRDRVREGILVPKASQISAQHKLGWEEAQEDRAATGFPFSFSTLFIPVFTPAVSDLSSLADVGEMSKGSLIFVHKYPTSCCFPNRSNLLGICGLLPTIPVWLTCFSGKFAQIEALASILFKLVWIKKVSTGNRNNSTVSNSLKSWFALLGLFQPKMSETTNWNFLMYICILVYFSN